ncbi:hypothetical protein Tco_0947614, partial [Tanacetum coccineum]
TTRASHNVFVVGYSVRLPVSTGLMFWISHEKQLNLLVPIAHILYFLDMVDPSNLYDLARSDLQSSRACFHGRQKQLGIQPSQSLEGPNVTVEIDLGEHSWDNKDFRNDENPKRLKSGHTYICGSVGCGKSMKMDSNYSMAWAEEDEGMVSSKKLVYNSSFNYSVHQNGSPDSLCLTKVSLVPKLRSTHESTYKIGSALYVTTRFQATEQGVHIYLTSDAGRFFQKQSDAFEALFGDKNNQAVDTNDGDQEDTDVKNKQEVKKADGQEIENVKDKERKNVEDHQVFKGNDNTNNDDIGYIEDELGFLAHKINYPNDNDACDQASELETKVLEDGK